MNLKAKNVICTLLAASCLGVLTAQQGGRGPVQTWWVAKTKGGVYIPPNKPLTRLADLKAMHPGQTNWTEVVVKDPEDEAYYNSAAPSAKFGRRMHPDTGALIVVVEGQMHFNIAGQDPIVATRGSVVNILRTTPYAYEVTGQARAVGADKPHQLQDRLSRRRSSAACDARRRDC
jgi:hypothetical protein